MLGLVWFGFKIKIKIIDNKWRKINKNIKRIIFKKNYWRLCTVKESGFRGPKAPNYDEVCTIDYLATSNIHSTEDSQTSHPPNYLVIVVINNEKWTRELWLASLYFILPDFLALFSFLCPQNNSNRIWTLLANASREICKDT